MSSWPRAISPPRARAPSTNSSSSATGPFSASAWCTCAATMMRTTARRSPIAPRWRSSSPVSGSRCSTRRFPRQTTGQVSADQLEWLDELGARSDRPVLVFGHHHVWSPESNTRHETYFGISPDDSERLIDVVAAAPRARRLLRGAHPPQPGASVRGDGRRPVGRGRVRQRLPRLVGGVPRVRGRHPAGAPAHLVARGTALDGPHPSHVRRPLSVVLVRHARRPLLPDLVPPTVLVVAVDRGKRRRARFRQEARRRHSVVAIST